MADERQIPLQLEDFCIGPVADRMSWHGERQQMKIDSGPCESFLGTLKRFELTCIIGSSSEDCLTSAARREMTCLRHAKPQPRQTFLLPTEHSVNPDEHMSLLERCLQLAPFLVPKDSSFRAPVLRHPDLTLNNILLAPGTTDIVSIIDWQDAIVFPSFLKAGYPAFCEHDSSRTQSLQIPKLPENFTSMSPEEQIQTKTKWRLEEANLFYTAATGIYNEAHMNNLKMPHLAMRQYLFRETGYPWDADIINLRMALVGITSPHVWDSISPLPCPGSFSDTEREIAIRESEGWNESEAMLKTIRDNIGIDLEGGTTPENFEWESLRNMEFRLEMQRHCEEHERELCWRNWPFKDDGDCSLPPGHV